MWNVSAFMHGVKQRFTQWYNGRKGRKGTLWEDRFKSVVVEGAGQALGAMAGRRGAKEGLQQGVESLSAALAVYRMHLYNEGTEEREAVDESALTRPPGTLSRGERGTVRGALRREAVLKVLRAKGKLPLGAYLRCRVRYFCDGAVFGSREFVEGMFRARRGWFGERRKSGARKMRGLLEGELFTVRDLRLNVFG